MVVERGRERESGGKTLENFDFGHTIGEETERDFPMERRRERG